MIFSNAGTTMPIWQIRRVDPGYLYVFEDKGRFKIGKLERRRNASKRQRLGCRT